MENGSFLAKGSPGDFFQRQCEDPRVQSFIDKIF
jgi:polar amino acid transport system ATP-binding protein